MWIKWAWHGLPHLHVGSKARRGHILDPAGTHASLKIHGFYGDFWEYGGNMVGIWWEYDKDKRTMIECLGFEWCIYIYIYSIYNDIDCWHPCYSCLGHASQPSRAQKELEGPLDSSFFPCPSPDSLAAAIDRLSSVAAQTSNVTFQKPQWAHLQSSKGAGVALPRFRWRTLYSHPCQWHAASSAAEAWK